MITRNQKACANCMECKHVCPIIGKDEFLGLTEVKRMTEHPDDGDTYESWQAPDLGCREMYTRKTQKDREGGSDRTELPVFPGRSFCG